MTAAAEQLRVMIVEDEPRLRELLVREIAAMGHAASAFRTAEAAWSSLQADAADVVLLDLNLPGMDGMELFGKIREQGLDVAVVILTGYGEFESAVQSLRWGADDYLTKPCSLGEIETVLARLREKKVARHRRERVQQREEVEPAGQQRAVPPRGRPPAGADSSCRLEDFEREHILAVLRGCDGNKPAAATKLGISLRTLYNKLQTYRQQGYLA